MWRFVVILFLNIVGYWCSDEWTYDLEIKWPGSCNTGNMQSPINIMTADAILDKHESHIRGPLQFRGYSNVNMTAENNGHTLKWMVTPEAPPPIVSGGPLRGNYSFIQFHLHWLSEHAIDGIKYPMEIHMVHMKTGLTTVEALKRPDGLAVIGILATVASGRESEIALEELAPTIPSLFQRHTEYPYGNILDLTRFFSPEMQSFYTYHGSLTTPQCQEVVTWIVMDKPIIISDVQYKTISKVDVGGINNYRSLQPTGREVYRSVASCATKPTVPTIPSITVPTSIGLFATFLNLSTSITTSISKGICTFLNIKKRLFGGDLSVCDKSDKSV